MPLKIIFWNFVRIFDMKLIYSLIYINLLLCQIFLLIVIYYGENEVFLLLPKKKSKHTQPTLWLQNLCLEVPTEVMRCSCLWAKAFPTHTIDVMRLI